MKKILVPTDGSECSKLAIDKALEIAKEFDSEVVLLYVSESSPAFIAAGTGSGAGTGGGTGGAMASGFGTSGNPAVVRDVDQVKERIQEKAAKVLESGKGKLMILGDKVSTVMLEGNPADAIVEFIDANKDIDLVIMGSHGMTGFRRFFIGSVTHKVTVSIDRPILIVR